MENASNTVLHFIVELDIKSWRLYFSLCVPLCGSSLRACLLGGGLLWSPLSGYNLFRELLETQKQQAHQTTAIIKVSVYLFFI